MLGVLEPDSIEIISASSNWELFSKEDKVKITTGWWLNQPN